MIYAVIILKVLSDDEDKLLSLKIYMYGYLFVITMFVSLFCSLNLPQFQPQVHLYPRPR